MIILLYFVNSSQFNSASRPLNFPLNRNIRTLSLWCIVEYTDSQVRLQTASSCWRSIVVTGYGYERFQAARMWQVASDFFTLSFCWQTRVVSVLIIINKRMPLCKLLKKGTNWYSNTINPIFILIVLSAHLPQLRLHVTYRTFFRFKLIMLFLVVLRKNRENMHYILVINSQVRLITTIS